MKILEDNNITKKLLGITMDNATSMIAIGRELKKKLETIGNNEFIYQRYAVHIINIAVQYGLQLALPITKTVREFVIKIRQSSKLCDSLKIICKLENSPELKPDLDIEI